jgi:dynein light intermediate chain
MPSLPAAAAPPPTLLFLDPPLLVDGPAEAAAAAAAAAKKAGTKGAAAHVEDIINSVLPPRMWEQADGSTWLQYTSKTPASRTDVDAVEAALDQRLQQRQARLAGLCPVRGELYAQVFDEMVREVTLDLPERGLLLLRVRDEARMTRAAYEALYDGSVTFSVRKQLQAEQGIAELEAEAAALAERKRDLEAQVLALRSKMDVIERKQLERRQKDEKRRAEELAYLKHNAKHLDLFLKSLPKA